MLWQVNNCLNPRHDTVLVLGNKVYVFCPNAAFCHYDYILYQVFQFHRKEYINCNYNLVKIYSVLKVIFYSVFADHDLLSHIGKDNFTYYLTS